MQATRRMRLQAVIQEELSQVVPREVKDPRVPSVTFTAVEVTDDGGQATVFVAILGGARGGHDGAPPLSDHGAKLRMKDCLAGLTSASGFRLLFLERTRDSKTQFVFTSFLSKSLLQDKRLALLLFPIQLRRPLCLSPI
jgi:ribosome-binding factor A